MNGQGDAPQVVIDIPKNTGFIAINGTSGPNQGTYTLGFSPDVMLAPAQSGQATGISSATWITPVLLAVTPLNPEIKYTLTISGGSTAPNDLALHSLTYYGGVL